MRIHDITMPLREGIPVWPGDASPVFRLLASHKGGDIVDVTHLSMVAHTGTHLDAPRHFVPDAGLVTGLDLRALIGPARVVLYEDEGPIPLSFFEGQDLPDPATRLLLHCRCHEGALEGDVFKEDYAGITDEAARWLVARGLRLIGTDYLSIGPYGDGNVATHRVLLGADVIIVEGLDLRGVEPGDYTLICLPIALPADGAPCRAVLLPAGQLPDPLDPA